MTNVSIRRKQVPDPATRTTVTLAWRTLSRRDSVHPIPKTERAVVQVRLTARDLKRVEALAASDRVTVSDLVRRLIRSELGDAKKEDGELS